MQPLSQRQDEHIEGRRRESALSYGAEYLDGGGISRKRDIHVLFCKPAGVSEED